MGFLTNPLNGITDDNNTTILNVPGHTTLNASLGGTAGDTTITLLDSSEFITAGVSTIVLVSGGITEYIKFGSVSGNDLINCTRGYRNSGISNYNSGQGVSGCFIGLGTSNNQSDVTVSLKSSNNGIEYFDFSNDNVNWDRFPVLGFNVAANIHEYHTAVKNPRYFSLVYINYEATATTSFRAYTYEGFFRQGNLPLNQSIGADADSTIVRSINVGQQPDNTYSNIKADGSAFRTTTNLQATTITISSTGTGTGNKTVADTSNFFAGGTETSGYVYIGSEFIACSVVDGTTLNFTERGAFGTTSSIADHAVDAVVGEAYTTGILILEGYTEVATKVTCNTTGRMRFQWYSDEAGTNNIRTIGPPYAGANVYDYLAAPNFGPYVRYTFANTDSGAAATTNFFFETEFYTKSISAQVLTLDSTIVTGMTSNLTRSIIAGRNKAGNFGNAPVDSENHLMVHVHDPTTAFGQLKVAEETTQISEYFPYNINSRRIIARSLITGVSTTTSGSGTGLHVDYSVNGSGEVDYITVGTSSRGTGYAYDDTLTIIAGNSDATGIVKQVTDDGTGAVLGISVNAPGTGYVQSGACVSQFNNMIALNTSANSYQKATARTVNTCKYQTGTGVVARFTGLFTPTAGNNQYIGIGDDNDGFFIGCSGTTFGILRRNQGTNNFTSQSNFNVDILDGSGSANNPSNINLDNTKGNVFSIQYQWLGFGAITYSVEDPIEGDFEPMHIIKYANNNTVPSVFNPTFPIYFENSNTTNATNIGMSSASCMAALEGKKNYNNFLFSKGITNDSTLRALVLKNKLYYQNKINKTNIIIKEIVISNTNAANNAPTKNFTFTLNGNITGASYNDQDLNTSVTEYSETVSTVSGGIVIKKAGVPGSDSRTFIFTPGELIISPGDTLHIVGDTSTNGYEIDAVWIEDQ